MRGNTRFDIVQSLKPLWNNRKKQAIGIVLAKFVCVMLGLLTPLLYKFFMNQVLMEQQIELLVYVVLGYIGLYLVMSIFTVMGQFCENKFRNLLRLNVKKHLLDMYHKLPVTEYEKYTIGDLRNRVEADVSKAEQFYTKHLVNFYFSIFSIILLVGIMIQMSWQLTVFGLLGVVTSFLATNVVGVKINKMSDKYRSDFGEFESIILYSLHNWKEIKMNNLEAQQQKTLDSKWVKIARLMKLQTIYKYLASALVAVNLFLVTRLGMYLVGGMLVLNNYMDVAALLVFITYYDKLHKEVNVLIQSVIDFQEEKPLIMRIVEIMSIFFERKKTVSLDGLLEVCGVSFAYEGGSEILSDINFSITDRTHVALVGRSGCGKTTLAKIMLGLLKPQKGSVCIGGINIEDVSEVSKSSVISAVMQEPKFFNLSIADNLRLVKSDVTQEELDEVCRMANIYDFIQELPQKYNTLIGEKGVKLSGGQKQRLAIARTLLRNPDIIIFDEATSALDNENEKAVMKAIQNLAQKKTIISIAHRFSTIAEADEIVLMQDGKIAARGNMQELLETNEEFRSLYKQQMV